MAQDTAFQETDTKAFDDYFQQRRERYRDTLERVFDGGRNLDRDDWGLTGTGNFVGYGWHGSLSLSTKVKDSGNQTLTFDGTFYGVATGAAEFLVCGDIYRDPKLLDGQTLTFQIAAFGANLEITFWDNWLIQGTVICTGIGTGLLAGGGQGTFALT